MKQFIHKTKALIMAFVVVLSTMSFTIDKHYCGSILVDLAINKKANTCGMVMSSSSEGTTHLSKMSCCQDEHIAVLGQDELKNNFDTSIDIQLIAEIWMKYKLQNPFLKEQDSFIPLGNHDPPDVIDNFQKLYETYII